MAATVIIPSSSNDENLKDEECDVGVFEKAIAEISHDSKVAIFTHRIPDPDALGSAWMLKTLLSLKGAASVIICDGELSHPQNLTMHNLLNIPIVKLEGSDLSSYTHFMCVDSITANTSLGDREALLCIDHHNYESMEKDSSKYKIFHTLGSCCTIMVELIHQLNETGWEIDISDSSNLVTCMLLGIKTDTKDLTSEGATDRDFLAYQHLLQYADRNKLAKIIDYPYPRYYLELERILSDETNHFWQDSYFVGGVGFITPKKKECLAMLADRMVRVEGTETAIVFAIIDKRLVASIRNTNTSIDSNDFAKSIFGKKFAGGRKGSAGASVPIESVDFENEELHDRIWEVFKDSQFSKVRSTITGG